MLVPHTEAPLLVPNRVAGWAVGKTANRAGTRIRPPPPTIESTKPASSEASEITINSMDSFSHRRQIAVCYRIESKLLIHVVMVVFDALFRAPHYVGCVQVDPIEHVLHLIPAVSQDVVGPIRHTVH